MNKTVLREGDKGVRLIVRDRKPKNERIAGPGRSPVHVVYGGADRFTAETPRKLGDIAIRSIETYAPNFVEFAAVMSLPGSGQLKDSVNSISKLEKQLRRDPLRARKEMFPAWLAWTVFEKVLHKLKAEPVEDFRIDFEDGYGLRPDEEEDADAVRCAAELARAFNTGMITPFSGIRIRALAAAEYGRAVRTFELFMDTLIKATKGRLPDNFVVTLPKITDRQQVKDLAALLRRSEKKHKLAAASIGIELMIETPEAIIDRKGALALPGLVTAAKGRCRSAHFGAYDYTGALGIISEHQHLAHPACDHARQLMLLCLARSGIRISDSVTTRLPVAVNRSDNISAFEAAENRASVHAGWQEHFSNVTRSMADGFYQSWDLHPNQLPARFAAVYVFFLTSIGSQAERLRDFVAAAARSKLTGAIFDDAASVRGIFNYFRSGLDCGALSPQEVENETGVSAAVLRAGDLSGILAAARDNSS